MKRKTTTKCHFGGIFKTPGQSPQTKLLIYTTSSKPSKKSLLKTYKGERGKKKEKHSLQQPGEGKKKKTKNKMADLKKFTTTLIQLHFLSHKNRSFPERKQKEKLQCSLLAKEHSQAQQNWYWISIYKRMMHVSFI